MNPLQLLPLEKIVNRPDIKFENSNCVETSVIPDEILKLIFSFLGSEGLASSDLVSKKWHLLTNNDALWNQAIAREINQCASFVFGKEGWNQYFGEIGNVPNYPRNICKILTDKCPFFEGKTVGETHMLMLVPEKVGEELLTLYSIQKLCKTLEKGKILTYHDFNGNGKDVFEKYGKISVKKIHWMIITKNLIPESIYKSYDIQQMIIKKHPSYHIPNAIDAVIAFFINYVSSGEYLLGGVSWRMYTRCQQHVQGKQVIVGSHNPAGLNVMGHYCRPDEDIGVLGCRSFDKGETKVYKQ